MLFCTSLMANIGAGEQPTLTPRKLFLFNTATDSVMRPVKHQTGGSVLYTHQLEHVAKPMAQADDQQWLVDLTSSAR